MVAQVGAVEAVTGEMLEAPGNANSMGTHSVVTRGGLKGEHDTAAQLDRLADKLAQPVAQW